MQVSSVNCSTSGHRGTASSPRNSSDRNGDKATSGGGVGRQGSTPVLPRPRQPDRRNAGKMKDEKCSNKTRYECSGLFYWLNVV